MTGEPVRNDSPESVWFWDHYESAANETLEFLRGDGIELEGLRVADVGCGDGMIDLGLAHRGRPAELVGFDLNPVDEGHLLRIAGEAGVATELPPGLRFVTSGPRALPAEDASFDVVVTWSAFEHVGEPISLLGEMRRIMKPGGFLFLQLWPFYHSARGSHLWDWFDDYVNLTKTEDEIVEHMRANPFQSEGWTEYMINEYRHLNRIDVDELQRSLLAAGLAVRKFELLTHTVRIPTELQRYPLSQLGIGGVKLLASRLS